MSAPAVLQAVYTEWKMVKGRKVLILSFELPLEAQEHVQQVLGTPMPDQSIWCAIARLKDGAAVAEAPPEEPKAIEMKGGRLAQRAGILCGDPLFQAWCEQELCHSDPVAAIYETCDVSSRKDLDHIQDAGERFVEMIRTFEAWKIT